MPICLNFNFFHAFRCYWGQPLYSRVIAVEASREGREPLTDKRNRWRVGIMISLGCLCLDEMIVVISSQLLLQVDPLEVNFVAPARTAGILINIWRLNRLGVCLLLWKFVTNCFLKNVTRTTRSSEMTQKMYLPRNYFILFLTCFETR